MTIIATVTDSRGVPIDLTDERWNHICTRHSELRRLRTEILEAVAAPTIRRPGAEADEVWYYLEGAGPSRWLKVVVVLEAGRGFIVTAFPRRRLP